MAKPMIKGGETERLMNSGGDQAFREVAGALAGKRLEVAVYALTRALTSACLNMPTHDEGVKLARGIADDVLNELELNRDDRDKLIAEARAAFHHKGGHA